MAESASKQANLLQPLPCSPLAAMPTGGSQPRTPSVMLTEREPRVQLVLRGDPDESRFASRAGDVLGFELPLMANTVSNDGACRAIWMGPREWLLVLPPKGAEGFQAELEDKLHKNHAAVVDVSHSRVMFGLSGPDAQAVLFKGCSIDLHPREFGPGQCVQTRLARCHMLLHQLDDTPSYDIYVHRSFARYAWAWLFDAGIEYGIFVSAA